MIVYLKKLFVLGVQPEQNFHQKKDIIFVNQACFVLIVCAILVFLCNLFFGFYQRIFVPISTLTLFVTTLFLQYRHQYKWAKILALSGALLSGISSTVLFGPQASTHYYILASLILGLVFFSKRNQHLVIFILHFLCFLLVQLYIRDYSPVFPGQDTAMLSYFHIPIVFICIFVTLSEFVLHYERFETRIKDLMDSITEHSELLEIEKNKSQVQAQILKNTNNQLLLEIEQKEEAQQKLIESNAELEQFAYVASHDLKEPLRTIGSFTQLLKRKLAPSFDDSTSEYYQFIVDGIHRMSSLLDDLLALSKLNRQVEIDKVDLSACVDRNLMNLNDAIKKSGGRVITSKLPVIYASEIQLNQLFQNLISNALKFRKLDTTPEIRIDCQEKKDHYVFSIKDNGIGIKQEFKEKIFIIFQRLNKKTKYEGTGIGLAICKKIVQNHLGKIWIESTYGEGTTFFFTISKKLEPSHASNETEAEEKELITDLEVTNV